MKGDRCNDCRNYVPLKKFQGEKLVRVKNCRYGEKPSTCVEHKSRCRN